MDAAEYDLMDSVEDRMWWYRAMHGHALRALRPLAPGARVLDAGCGTGGFLARLSRARPDAELYGIEFAPAAAARAAAKAGARVACGTVNALPFPNAHFDAVTSLDVICHGGVEPALALAEFRRVLRPGGLLVLNLPGHDWLKSAHDLRVHNVRRFERAGARALLTASGFDAPDPRHWNSLLLPLMMLQRKVLARGEDDASDVAAYPAWLDASLYAVCRAEAGLLRAGLRFPAGGSLLTTALRSESRP